MREFGEWLTWADLLGAEGPPGVNVKSSRPSRVART